MEGHDCFALKETDEHRQLRCVAFVAVAVSTMAVVCAVVTLPLLFNYVQDFQSHLMVETGFCKTRSRDMLLEMTALQLGKGHANRIKRGWLFGQWHPEKSVDGGKDVPSQRIERMSQPAGGQYGQPAAGYQPVVAAEATCCTCHQGPPGPVGSEGPPGVDGQDGTNGKDGTNGRDAQSIPAPTEDICIMCPAGPPGPMGPPGTKGPPGPKGSPGEPPKDGTPGDIGQQGQPGPIGQPGREGPRGASGQPGRLIPVSGPQGVPGPAGEPGQQGAKGAPGPDGQSFQGPPGPPGDAGKAGRSGRAGAPGPSGPPGQDGEVGSCDHCPEPRTPPGYFAGAGGGGRGDNYFN